MTDSIKRKLDALSVEPEEPNSIVMRLLTEEEIDMVAGGPSHTQAPFSSYTQTGGNYTQDSFTSYSQTTGTVSRDASEVN
jgi:hypothetical protein